MNFTVKISFKVKMDKKNMAHVISSYIFCFLCLTVEGKGISELIKSKGNCSCGGFAADSVNKEAGPLLAQTPDLIVKCDAEGEEVCQRLCLALAATAKAKGPSILCLKLGSASDLLLAVYHKICNKPWTYSGMKAQESLCCENSRVKQCPTSSTKKMAKQSIMGEVPAIKTGIAEKYLKIEH